MGLDYNLIRLDRVAMDSLHELGSPVICQPKTSLDSGSHIRFFTISTQIARDPNLPSP